MIKYSTASVREYWIVDPEDKKVMVYGFEADSVRQYNFGSDIPVGIFDGCSIIVE